MAEGPPEKADERSFSDLTVELIEQTAALAGERISAPIRSATSTAARLLALAALAIATAVVGLVFVGIAVGLLVGRAPEASRWWICLLVALGFFLTAGAIGLVGFRRKASSKSLPPDSQDRPPSLSPSESRDGLQGGGCE
jgi:F0F1-type ATP synthase assembly protein I